MINVVIPMAGLGSRFSNSKYNLPKPLININGKPMITRAIQSLDITGTYHFILRHDEYLDDLVKVIEQTVDDPKFIILDKVTEGPASTVLECSKYINNYNELIVANCDQIMEYNSKDFITHARKFDGCVVTYHNDTTKNSYAKINRKGLITELAEKKVISNIALVGIHYWCYGKMFVESANKMIQDQNKTNNEYYIAPSYNYLIKDLFKIGIHHIPNQQYHAVGTPEDLDKFIDYENELLRQ